jgi:HAD superfamily hydrolase (TIGR01484 family)
MQEIRQGAEEAVLGKASLTRALDGMLEVLPPSASKGAGVTKVLKHMGISPDDVLAIGDGENDLEMLELAGVRIMWLV